MSKLPYLAFMVGVFVLFEAVNQMQPTMIVFGALLLHAPVFMTFQPPRRYESFEDTLKQKMDTQQWLKAEAIEALNRRGLPIPAYLEEEPLSIRTYSNEELRQRECRALAHDWNTEDLFFCGLGTLGCTESHGDLAWQGPDEWASREP